VSTTVITVNDKVETVMGQARLTSCLNKAALEMGILTSTTGTADLENGREMQKTAETLRCRGDYQVGSSINWPVTAALPHEPMPGQGTCLAWLGCGGSSSGGSSGVWARAQRC
jgi:hypothetical protein